MNEQFSVALNIEQINAILRQLDNGSHKEVRPLIDSIIQQVNAQQQARMQAAQETAPEEAAA